MLKKLWQFAKSEIFRTILVALLQNKKLTIGDYQLSIASATTTQLVIIIQFKEDVLANEIKRNL